MEAYAEGSLELLCEERMKEIWGEDSQVKIELYSPDSRKLPAVFSTETSLEVLLSDCIYFYLKCGNFRVAGKVGLRILFRRTIQNSK